ncbi:hypothetical protein C8R43DRAFT_946023 [Mycena crocata]|nr:hypothetical protein C8R43DRAFT_946023 [Mycena crocata]
MVAESGALALRNGDGRVAVEVDRRYTIVPDVFGSAPVHRDFVGTQPIHAPLPICGGRGLLRGWHATGVPYPPTLLFWQLALGKMRVSIHTASSRAIASIRQAVDILDDFEKWLSYQAKVATEPRHNGCVGWSGLGQATGAWAYDAAPWRLELHWGFGGWEARHHYCTDPDWDGVTLVPKIPGKKNADGWHFALDVRLLKLRCAMEWINFCHPRPPPIPWLAQGLTNIAGPWDVVS